MLYVLSKLEPAQDLHARKTFVAGTLSAPLIPLLGFLRVTNSLLTYLNQFLVSCYVRPRLHGCTANETTLWFMTDVCIKAEKFTWPGFRDIQKYTIGVNVAGVRTSPHFDLRGPLVCWTPNKFGNNSYTITCRPTTHYFRFVLCSLRAVVAVRLQRQYKTSVP